MRRERGDPRRQLDRRASPRHERSDGGAREHRAERGERAGRVRHDAAAEGEAAQREVPGDREESRATKARGRLSRAASATTTGAKTRPVSLPSIDASSANPTTTKRCLRAAQMASAPKPSAIISERPLIHATASAFAGCSANSSARIAAVRRSSTSVDSASKSASVASTCKSTLVT